MGSSTSTRNFGMRRFTNTIREGRFRAPAASALRLGTLVEIDPGDTDRVRQATAVAIGGAGDVRLGLCGILWYEHDSQDYNDPRFGGAAGLLPQDLDTAPVNRMVQVIHGSGTKVWLRNTDLDTTEPGLNFPAERAAVVMYDGTPAVDDLLGWNTTGFYAVTALPEEAALRVTHVYAGQDRLDAELLV
jgi:hypothetical protein